MEIWQIALFLLAFVWLLQSVGTWFQMRHFQDVMGAVSHKWSDGRVGAGNARGRLGKGVIAVVVVDPADIVRRVLLMEGRSVLAKFQPLKEWEGRPLGALRDAVSAGSFDAGRSRGRGRAILSALDQLDRVGHSEAGAVLATA